MTDCRSPRSAAARSWRALAGSAALVRGAGAVRAQAPRAPAPAPPAGGGRARSIDVNRARTDPIPVAVPAPAAPTAAQLGQDIAGVITQ